MKWTSEQIDDLKSLCFQGINNKTLANHFGVPVVEIHAKRSQLGITMPKVAAAQGKPAITVNPEFEAAIVEAEKVLPLKMDEDESKRQLFFWTFDQLLKMADPNISKIELIDEGRTALVIHKSGIGTRVDIEGDSLLAIIADVTRKCLF